MFFDILLDSVLLHTHHKNKTNDRLYDEPNNVIYVVSLAFPAFIVNHIFWPFSFTTTRAF